MSERFKPKEGYVDYARLYEEGRIPEGMTWFKWQTMSNGQRQECLAKREWPHLAKEH